MVPTRLSLAKSGGPPPFHAPATMTHQASVTIKSFPKDSQRGKILRCGFRPMKRNATDPITKLQNQTTKGKFMTKRLLVAIALVGTGTLMCAALAELPDKTQNASEKLIGDRLEKLHKRLLQELKLTKKQDAPVRKILASHRQGMVEWSRKNAPEMEKLQQRIMMVHQGKSTEAVEVVKAAAQKLRKLKAEQSKMSKGLVERLKKVLTETQLAKAMNILNPAPQIKSSPPFYLLRRLDLTKKQQARIEKIEKTAKSEGAKAGKANDNSLQKAWDQILTEVLTEKDRKKLDELEKASQRLVFRAMLGGVDLTEEQFSKIDLIWRDAKKKASKHPETKLDIFRQAHAKIV